VISEDWTVFIDFQKPLTANVDEKERRPFIDDIDDIGMEMAAILCSRPNVQRREISRVYLAKYGEELSHRINETFTREFRELIHALLETPARYDASQLHRAITSTSVFTVSFTSVIPFPF
jgi:hypothetical protein